MQVRLLPPPPERVKWDEEQYRSLVRLVNTVNIPRERNITTAGGGLDINAIF